MEKETRCQWYKKHWDKVNFKEGRLVYLHSGSMCWTINLENDNVVGRYYPEGEQPSNMRFYWGDSLDWSFPGRAGRFLPREETIGFLLGRTISLDLKSFRWPNSMMGEKFLHLIYTNEYGLVAVQENDIKHLQNPNK